MSTIERQLLSEENARAAAGLLGCSVVQSALTGGRYTDLPVGRVVLARAFEDTKTRLTALLAERAAGVNAKYRALLRRISVDVAAALVLRVMLNAATNPTASRLQDILRHLGSAVESECMVDVIERAGDSSAAYMKRTLEYLDTGHTQSIEHRRRTFLAAAEHTIGTWVQWSAAEREGVARLLLLVAWETGLFDWANRVVRGGKARYLIPTPELQGHLNDLRENALPIVRYLPMLCKPEPWTSYGAGGYLTPWMRVHAPMVSLHGLRPDAREWVLSLLPKATKVLSALNAAQSVPYRVNQQVLRVFRAALAIPEGVMGLPEHGQSQMPAFPHSDTWKKTAATAEELEAFQLWKVQMAEWYAKDSKRHSKKHALSLASRILATVQEETELYFVTYADYRGRIYFRGTVHPQAHDSVKGCLEFAEGKQLGATGLFWLKAHVAACAGFDKADFPLRVQWTEQNWHWIERWIRAPLDSPAPDPDTAFTFLAAAGALSEALAMPDPTRYICHIPVAVDATCSGLQHFSALFRDEVGGRYTNLFDSGGTEKQDIYKAVADKAVTILDTPDSNIQSFWGAQGIDRSMSKRPVMTYVYGSTLQSNMEYIALSLLEAGVQPIKDGDKVLYSLLKLSVPVAKAIRRSVQQTVPKAAEGMNYLQKLARYSSEPLRWITPAGMPVVNWSEGAVVRKVFIRAMGVTCILMRRNNGLYDKAKAAEAISPNFIHSLDSSHLCMVLDQVYYPVLPIHDSFACHPCNVDALQQTLRTAFLELYQDNPLEAIMITHDTSDKTIPKVPSSGTLDIRRVLHSRFMFC